MICDHCSGDLPHTAFRTEVCTRCRLHHTAELQQEVERLKAREADLLRQIEAVKEFIKQLVSGLQKTATLE